MMIGDDALETSLRGPPPGSPRLMDTSCVPVPLAFVAFVVLTMASCAAYWCTLLSKLERESWTGSPSSPIRPLAPAGQRSLSASWNEDAPTAPAAAPSNALCPMVQADSTPTLVASFAELTRVGASPTVFVLPSTSAKFATELARRAERSAAASCTAVALAALGSLASESRRPAEGVVAPASAFSPLPSSIWPIDATSFSAQPSARPSPSPEDDAAWRRRWRRTMVCEYVRAE